jgi:hypothetical protein
MNRDLFLRSGHYLARHPFRTFAALVLMALSLTYFLHRSSYCFSGARFVSDQEMIYAAITDEIWGIGLPKTYVDLPDPGERELPFSGVSNFEELNPGCCKILTGDEERSALHLYGFLDRLFGYYAVVVGLDYNLRYLDKQGIEHLRVTHSEVAVSSCGKVHLEALRGG